MRLRNPFTADADDQPAQESASETKAAPLRSVLIAQLKQKAEAGDLQAIRILLDSPSLLEERPIPETLPEAREALRKLLADLAARSPMTMEERKLAFLEHVKGAVGQFPDLLIEMDERVMRVKEAPKQVAEMTEKLLAGSEESPAERWEKATEKRLTVEEGSELALSTWKEMKPEVRAELWNELRDGLRELGKLRAEHVQTLVQ